MIKVGVIGARGYMGSNHVRNFRALEESGLKIRLCAVADVDPRVEELAAAYGVSAYRDHREMFGDVDLDAITVAVPTAYHHQIVCDALKSGLHVMVEKPIAFSVKEAREMVELAKVHERILMVGHVEWFNPVVRELVRLIRQGLFGEILMIEAKRLNPFPMGRDDAVGVSVDLATHDIYNVLRILRMIGSSLSGGVVAVGGSSLLTPTRFEDHISMFLPADGVVAEVTASWLHPFKLRQTTIVGTKGTAVVDLISREIVFYPVGGGYDARDMSAALYDLAYTERHIPVIPNRRVEPLRIELQEFASAVLEDRAPEVTGEEALEVLEIALKASHQVLKGDG